MVTGNSAFCSLTSFVGVGVYLSLVGGGGVGGCWVKWHAHRRGVCLGVFSFLSFIFSTLLLECRIVL